MISSEEREGESEERNFISSNYSLNVQYFPLHIKCSHETQYSLLARVITYLRGIPEKKWATCNLGVHSWHSSDRSPEYNHMGINSMKHLGRHLIYVALHRLEI